MRRRHTASASAAAPTMRHAGAAHRAPHTTSRPLSGDARGGLKAATARCWLLAVVAVLLPVLDASVGGSTQLGRVVWPIPDDIQALMRKYTWRDGCPVAIHELAYAQVPYMAVGGATELGEVIIHRLLATELLEIFDELRAVRYPLHMVRLVERFGGSDNASMEANNTSAFNCRLATGRTCYSNHAYGCAIDVNPFTNPYVKGSEVLPPDARPYANRSVVVPGTILPSGPVVDAFRRRGWLWGGDWWTRQDYQHVRPTCAPSSPLRRLPLAHGRRAGAHARGRSSKRMNSATKSSSDAASAPLEHLVQLVQIRNLDERSIGRMLPRDHERALLERMVDHMLRHPLPRSVLLRSVRRRRRLVRCRLRRAAGIAGGRRPFVSVRVRRRIGIGVRASVAVRHKTRLQGVEGGQRARNAIQAELFRVPRHIGRQRPQ